MDQMKIGKFIATRRKEKGFTQMQLAQELGITDRAVSKWENGKALPDASLMLQLCEKLGISVTELLRGEVIAMENTNQELEKQLLEMVREKELRDKQLLRIEWVLGILSILILFVPIIFAAYMPLEDWQRIVLIFSGFIPAIVGFCFSMKIEQVAGYYECKLCGHKYVPTSKAMYMAPHMGRTRHMTCPACGKKSWQKKVINKD